jgi:Vacuolar sorting protein 9 (VPS9) domain
MQEIEIVLNKLPDAQWPKKLIESTKAWNTMKDHKWRSNVLWYDYLQSYKKPSTVTKPTMTTILYAPVHSSNPNSFEAQSLLDFLHEHFIYKKEHYIAYMISKFNYFFIKEHLNIDSNSPISTTEAIIKSQIFTSLSKLVEEVKCFVMLVLQSMIHYYGGVVSKIIQEKPGEMYDLILEEVFTDSLQHCLLKAFYETNKDCDVNYREKIEKYSNLSCADLGIDLNFQIDLPRTNEVEVGYAKAISKLREIEYNYSPLKKLDVIIATTRIICECVDDYWKNDPNMRKENLTIDADQILSIFLYIVIKAKVMNLKGHLNLIYDFGRKIVQNGQMGYYVTTIEACIIQVESMDSDLLRRLKNCSEKD